MSKSDKKDVNDVNVVNDKKDVNDVLVMSEKDKKDVNDVNVVNDKSQDIPMPPPNAPAPVPKLTVVEPKNIGNKSDWEKNWETQKGGSGATWKISKTYNTYKDKLINYLQTVMNFKTNMGLKRKAAKQFLEYSNSVASQFENISRKKPLTSVTVVAAKKNLEIAKSAIDAINSDIKTLKSQAEVCKDYAAITTVESLSNNNQIARSKSFGRGWLPVNHLNETLYQIEQGKSSGAGGKTKDKYKLDILKVLGIDPDSDALLFEGFDAKTITLGALSTFFTDRKDQIGELLKRRESELIDAKVEKAKREKALFVAEEDIKLAKKQMDAGFNNRVRKAFRLGNEVLEGNLFNLLISDNWSPLDGQTTSSYSKPKMVNIFSKVLNSTLGKVTNLFAKNKEDVRKDSERELTDSIAEGKDDTEDWKHLSKLWPGYIVLDKLLTSNYAVAILLKGSLDSQTLPKIKIKKNVENRDFDSIILRLLDLRAGEAQSKLKELKTANEIDNFLIANGLSPRQGPFLVQTHKSTGKPVLSPTVIKTGKLNKDMVQKINDRLGLTSIEEEDKAAKDAKKS
jgi:hypothetical protein